jgi:hypothetical protein
MISVFIGVALAVILLAASLPNLEFRLGSWHFVEKEKVKSGSEVFFSALFIENAIRYTILFFLVILPILIIHQVRTPKGRRQILILFCVCIVYFLVMDHIELNKMPGGLQGCGFKGLVDDEVLPFSPAEEIISHPPWWLVYMVSLGLSAMILGGFLFLWRRLRRRFGDPLELVAQEAKKTLEELQAGADPKERVIRCYFEMSRVLNEQRGVKRKLAMTTREFEKYLEAVGLQDVHVRRLTRLFEMVRYGAKNLDERENREAVACLKAIVRACEGSQ